MCNGKDTVHITQNEKVILRYKKMLGMQVL
jgi:hypothetical protein